MSKEIENFSHCAVNDHVVREMLDDLNLMDNNPDEYDRKENIRNYAEAKKQIETMQTITFGYKTNVLLITDRLSGCAKGLQEYLLNSTDIRLDLVNTLEKAQQIINQIPIDFLIIVGYLKNDINYQSINAVRKINKYASVIMYASLDYIIKKHCVANNIGYTYDRHDPMDGFVVYMKKCYKEQAEQLYRDFPKKNNDEEEYTEKLIEFARLDAIQRTIITTRYEEQMKEKARIEEKKKKRIKKIFSICGITILTIVFLGLVAFSVYQNVQFDGAKEYTYTLQELEGSLVINVSINDESVKVTLKKLDDNAVSIFENTGVLSLENALKNELIRKKESGIGKSYFFVEQNILLYCLMDLAA